MSPAHPPEALAGRLLRYLATWQDAHGAPHGVHTHPVWRLHPGLLEDHYTGYSAWGAPYLMGLADLVALTGHDRIAALALACVRFVLTTQMADDGWDNAGAELGRRFNASCVDNMLQDLSLAYFAGRLRTRLGEPLFAEIGERVARNLRKYRQPESAIRAQGYLVSSTVNQDCAGIWACFEWMRSFGWEAQLEADCLLALDEHLKRHFVASVPDTACGGMLRADNLPDYIEPAEYYGVIIPPFICAWRRTGDARYARAAWAMARHVMRNAWLDHQGCRRLHRSCDKIAGVWRVSHTPMLIAGGGLFLLALQELLALEPDEEAEGFLRDMIRTLGFYQNEYGFIAQASGWHDAFDVIAGTVWQCHDLAFLGRQVRDVQAFVRAYEAPSPDLGLTIGWTDSWAENARQWAILHPFSMGFSSVGAKHADYGYPSMPAWCGFPHPAMEFEPKIEVRLLDDTFIIRAPEYKTLTVQSLYGKKWERET